MLAELLGASATQANLLGVPLIWPRLWCSSRGRPVHDLSQNGYGFWNWGINMQKSNRNDCLNNPDLAL